MSIFINGDFKINESWEKKEQKPSKNSIPRSSSKSRDKNRLISAANNIIENSSQNILDDRAVNHILKEFKAEIPPISSIKSEKKISGKDSSQSSRKYPPRQKNNESSDSLLTSMASRLKQVEALCQNQRKEIKEQQGTIEKLKGQNTFLKGLRQNSDELLKKQETLDQKNKQLEKKVSDMEEYLKKYGLKWVGNNIQGDLNHKKMKKDIANSKHHYRLPSQVDIRTIQLRVQQLNACLHSQGQGAQIYVQNGVHKFRKAEPLPITFFGNGIGIKGYRFYSYQTRESLKILSDLVDGYFPYILKSKYPNGVFLQVIDEIQNKFSEEEKDGQQICSLKNIQNEYKPPSKDQFLQKLPKNIIKNGKIIPIREEIQKQLNGEEERNLEKIKNEDFEQAEGFLIFRTECHGEVLNEIKKPEEICTLKIRTQEGKICILQLSEDEKIQEVYKWMRKVVNKKFKLMGNYPKRIYEQNQKENLNQLGLFPNAILHIQII